MHNIKLHGIYEIADIDYRFSDGWLGFTHEPTWFHNPKFFVPLEDWQQAETMVEVLKEDLELVEVV